MKKEQHKEVDLSEQRRISGNKKLPYKCPQLNIVQLFADEVLGTCLAGFGSDCPDGPCHSLGK